MMRRSRPLWSMWMACGYLALLVLLAIFAPLLAGSHGLLTTYSPAEADAFAPLLPPGPQRLRVLPLSGSDAAQQLGLTKLTPVDGDSSLGEPVMRNQGSQAGPSQFAIVTASMDHFIVPITDRSTPAQVAAQITRVADGRASATFDPATRRITLHDFTKPAPVHWLGTDRHGSDVAADMIFAARTALLVAIVATLVAFVLGVIIGLVMGALGGWFDFVGLRLIEVFSAVPRLLLLLIVAGAMSAANATHMAMVLLATIGLTSWMTPARLVRGEMLRLRDQEFVLAANAIGAPAWRVMMRHLLPNAIVPVLVDATFFMSAAVLIETNLSFLGLGVHPPATSWGAMLADAIDRSTGSFHWWLLAGPGAMVFLTILSIHTIGEWWRRWLGVKPSWVASS